MSLRYRTVFSTGNEELDSRIGGGIPFPAFILIEGDNGTAKTTLALQIVLGALKSGFRVVYFTTESTPALLLRHARNITFNLTSYYIKGQLTIYSLYSRRPRKLSVGDLRSAFGSLLVYLSESQAYNLAVIDSITVFLQAEEASVARFVEVARSIVSRGRSLIATLHSGVLSEAALRQLRAASDVYYRLGLANVGGKTVKVLQIVKARGAPEPIEGTVAFDVDPAFGIKIVPVVVAQS